MKNLSRNILMAALLLITAASCKKDDYFIGGTLHQAKVDMTTYDFLRSNDRKLFDTLLLLIDRAGVKELINKPDITFMAPTNYDIRTYLQKKTAAVQVKDPKKRYTVDTLIKYDLATFRDSINTYIVPQKVLIEAMTENGKQYSTAKTGSTGLLSYETTYDTNLGYNANSSVAPRIVYYTFLYQPLTGSIKAEDVTAAQGTRVRVQTAGVQTNTGVVHVLAPHTLYFRK